MRNGPVCLLFGLLMADPVLAQLPAPDARYTDPDPAAQYVTVPEGRQQRDIEKILRRDPGNVAARVQNALSLYARNKSGRGAGEFDAAIAAAREDALAARYARWNLGWALFESARPDAALEQWRRCADEHGGTPFWLPALEALVAWVNGDQVTAGAWYAVAVASDPARWETADALAATAADWPVNARFSLESVRQHWADNR